MPDQAPIANPHNVPLHLNANGPWMPWPNFQQQQAQNLNSVNAPQNMNNAGQQQEPPRVQQLAGAEPNAITVGPGHAHPHHGQQGASDHGALLQNREIDGAIWCFNCHSARHSHKCCSEHKKSKSWTIRDCTVPQYFNATITPRLLYHFVGNLRALSQYMVKFDAFIEARDKTQLLILTRTEQILAERSGPEITRDMVDFLHKQFCEGNNHTEKLRLTYDQAARQAWSKIMRSCAEDDVEQYREQLRIPSLWRRLDRTDQLKIFRDIARARQRAGLRPRKSKEEDIRAFRDALTAGTTTYTKEMYNLSHDSRIARSAEEVLRLTSQSNMSWCMLYPQIHEESNFVPGLKFPEEEYSDLPLQ